VRRTRILLGLALASLLVAACETRPEGAVSSSSRASSAEVVTGSFNFPESQILAEIYEHRLRARGIPAEVISGVASREVMEPALEQGVVDVVPEYLGTALEFLRAESDIRTSSPARTHERLQRAFAERGVEVLDYASAQDRNEIVVTGATARRFGLRNISDLRSVADELAFGGPPECPSRPNCLLGLESLYDLHFASFHSLDAGGPLTVAALNEAQIDVGLMFTTDPQISRNGFVALRDDRHLQPAENVVPVVRREVIESHGERVARALNEVSAELQNRDLIDLIARVTIDGRDPEDVARQWLDDLSLGART
jgi:osmoprotectant transport system substrate-binding protein